ncbi:hypothetical protein [Salmonirosea aquatica]|uniref:DUF1570 domain-containing protein n=1 Tax=Salmonirosea aquatica TaxID=2654236 RepID=A0A7C9F446_9BACT|nr:hypothetical protein [Cytophagaceae bacterium SJW1-29]
MIGILLAVTSYFFLYSHIFYCQTIAYSDFEKVSENLYVSDGIDQSQRQQMYASIRKARSRVVAFWGKSMGEATLILCSNPDEYQKYCHSSEGAGCSLGTPWGDSYIILNPYGLNEDVISHEMCHDELFSRLGWWRATTQIPQWFNEGLALMLDRRFVPETDPLPRYLSYKDEWMYLTHGAQEVLELDDLSSMKGFFGGNQRHVMLAYMTAGMEVAYWLMLTNPRNVRVLLDAVARGGEFTSTYERMRKAGEIQRHVPPSSSYPLR